MRNRSEKFSGMKDDILGAGFHLLSGAGGDLKLLIQQAVQRLVGDNYVSREEYHRLAARVDRLEGKNPAKTAKSSTPVKKKPASKKATKPRK